MGEWLLFDRPTKFRLNCYKRETRYRQENRGRRCRIQASGERWCIATVRAYKVTTLSFLRSSMDTLGILVAGFSAVTAALLLVIYIWLIDFPNKSIYSILSCSMLLSALACIQVLQLFYFMGGKEPLDIPAYRLALF